MDVCECLKGIELIVAFDLNEVYLVNVAAVGAQKLLN
jgi:hypothetical protein